MYNKVFFFLYRIIDEYINIKLTDSESDVSWNSKRAPPDISAGLT